MDKLTTRQIVRGSGMPDHPIHPDIDFISGEFWGRNPHEELRWMRANAPVYWDGHVWGIARYDDVQGGLQGPDDVLERRRHPARHRPDPDDDRHGRSRALVPAQAGEQGLHAAAGAGQQRGEIREVLRRDHRRRVRAGRVRLRLGHRRSAAADHDRRRARRRARGPRRRCSGGPTTCCRGLTGRPEARDVARSTRSSATRDYAERRHRRPAGPTRATTS